MVRLRLADFSSRALDAMPIGCAVRRRVRLLLSLSRSGAHERCSHDELRGHAAGPALWRHEHPEPSTVGIAVTAISILVMQWLARSKRRTAARLASRALEADAFQTRACFWLSVMTLAGIGLNAAVGWWWADPVAALAMTLFIAKEGLEDCGCESAVTREPQAPPACGCSPPGAGPHCR
jgi:hypothetical protein